MEKCRPGEHSLITILRADRWDCSKVARWCSMCGSIVVDIDVDGRTQPGRIMKMRSPKVIAEGV